MIGHAGLYLTGLTFSDIRNGSRDEMKGDKTGATERAEKSITREAGGNSMKRINLESESGKETPLSAAVVYAGLVYVSGQAAIEPSTAELRLGDFRSELLLTLENLRRVLEAAGTDLEHTIKCTVYLADMGDYEEMNEVFSSFFGRSKPARTTIQAVLAFGLKVEVDAVAGLP